jgi:hypothetical protein
MLGKTANISSTYKIFKPGEAEVQGNARKGFYNG